MRSEDLTAGDAAALDAADSGSTRRRVVAGGAAGMLGALGVGLLNPESALAGTLQYDVTTYGATGNGTTNDTSSIQSAINAASAAGGGIVAFPAGTYLISTQITGAANVSLRGSGRGATTLLLADATGNGVSFGGSASSPVSLSASLNEYDVTATLSSASGYSAGDLVYFDCSSSSLYGKWVARVLSVAGNVLTLQEPCPTSLLTANGAQVRRLTTVIRNCVVSDLTIKTNTASPANRSILLYFGYSEDIAVERVRFENSKSDAIAASGCRNIVIRDCVATGSLQANTALNFEIDGCTGVLVSGNEVHNCSSGIVLSGSPRSVVSDNRLAGNNSSGGRGIKFLDRSNYGVCQGNVVSGFATTHTAVYVNDSWGCSFVGNEIDNCGTAFYLGSAIGSGNDTHHNSIVGNTIRKITEQGIVLGPTGISNLDTFNVVEGNTIQRCTDAGIAIGTNRNIVKGNTITDYATTAAHGIVIYGTGKENLVEGNTVVANTNPNNPNSLHSYGSLANYWVRNHTPENRLGMANADTYVPLVPGGRKYISTSESRSNTAYGVLATPDQVQVLLPTDGLIVLMYQATWQESVSGAGRAAIFIGSNQLKMASPTDANPVTEAAATNLATAAVDHPLFSSPVGLLTAGKSMSNPPAYGGDVSTGQVVGAIRNVGGLASQNTIDLNGVGSATAGNDLGAAGPCYVFVTAGTYDVSIQFKASSGSVTVKNRKLWVWVQPLPSV